MKEWVICMSYVPTTKQATNILTKGLTNPLFEKLIHEVRRYNLSNLAWGGVQKNDC